jgi:hypothetical protein
VHNWKIRLFNFAIHTTIWLALLVFSLPLIPEAYAATQKQEDGVEDLINESLTDEPLIEDNLTTEEAPPKPEYPYPGADEADTPAKKTAKAPVIKTLEDPPQPAPKELERPVKVDDEGNYYYDLEKKAAPASQHLGDEKPESVNSGEDYQYSKEIKAHTYRGAEGREKPTEMKTSGEFYYKTEVSPQNASASLRFGILTSPSIRNPTTGFTFQDIYGKSDAPILLGDYEWRLTSSVGRIGLKFTSGLYAANGVGKFVKTNPDRRIDDIPEEKFTFIMLPNQFTGIYKFQYADAQIFVPYVEGGAGYFTFTEIRDDGKFPKFGGAAVAVAAGGVNILMDWVDQRSVRQLDNDWGINHVWFSAELRVLVGLNKDYDFSSNVVNAGFLMDF